MFSNLEILIVFAIAVWAGGTDFNLANNTTIIILFILLLLGNGGRCCPNHTHTNNTFFV